MCSSDLQTFAITGTKYRQDITQKTLLESLATQSIEGKTASVTRQTYNWPLVTDISVVVNSDGSEDQTTKVNQQYQLNVAATPANQAPFTSSLFNAGAHVDTLEFDSSGNFVGNIGMTSGQRYSYTDSTGANYKCAIAAANNVLTSFSGGCAQ